MKKILRTLIWILIITAASQLRAASFARGADISWCTEMEADGKKFYNSQGVETDIFALMKSIGMNAIRLRVWVNPSNAYGAWCDKADVLAKARRAKAQNLDLMIDFHYSDFFTDPATQTQPADWSGYNATQVKNALVAHTTDVLQALKDEGITPKWVQVGNETDQGMVWATGEITWNPNNFANYVTLSNAGYDAVKAVFPAAYVIVHHSDAYKDLAWFYTAFKNAGGKFDMIGLSHYPETDWASTTSGSMSNYSAAQTVQSLGNTFNVPVMIVETGFSSTNATTADAVMTDLMTRMKALSQCAGVFYWEPEVYNWWKPSYYTTIGWNAYAKGAFTSNGRPSAALNAFAADDLFPGTLSVYDSGVSTLLATFNETATDGVYQGQLTLSSWQNFKFKDETANVVYGSEPNSLHTLTSSASQWNLWVDDGEAGTYDIEVDLNNMTWSYTLHQQSGTTFPTELIISKWDSNQNTNVTLATLSATSSGIYEGQLEVTENGMTFNVVDQTNNIWYKTDPNDATAIVTTGYNFWISGDPGTYDLRVNLNTMTWEYWVHVTTVDTDYWYLSGDFNSWALDSSAQFTQDATNTDVFTLSNFTIAAGDLTSGQFVFRVACANWTESYVLDSEINYEAAYTLASTATASWSNIYCNAMRVGVPYTLTWNRATHVLTIEGPAGTAATPATLYQGGTAGATYAVSGLICVRATPFALYCKDNNGYVSPSVKGAGEVDYIKERTSLQPGNWDQSNWVAVALPQELTASEITACQGHQLTTLKATWDNTDGNGTLTALQQPVAGTASDYTMNVFTTANFLGNTQTVGGTSYFFVTPKPMEIAHVTWAVWSDAKQAFVAPQQTAGTNAAGLDGGFYPNYSMLDETFTPVDGQAYDFVAQIRLAATGSHAPRRAGGDSSTVGTDYVVYPMQVLNTPGVVTGVATVKTSPADAGTFYNLLGQPVKNPAAGIYIRDGKKVIVR